MSASLGQPTMIMRNYSQRAVIGYSSFRDLGNTVLISLPLTILISGVIFSLYRQMTTHILLVFLTVNSHIVIVTEAQMLNAVQQYTWRNSLIRLPNSLLILPALYVLNIQTSSPLSTVLETYTVVSAVVAVWGLVLLGKYLPIADQMISWKERLT